MRPERCVTVESTANRLRGGVMSLRISRRRVWAALARPRSQLQHARPPADLGSGRQRLDRLLGPVRPELGSLLLPRGNGSRASASCSPRRRGPRRAEAAARARVSRGRPVGALFRERALDVRPGRLRRPRRPGLERHKVLANFTRVETFGATNNHWVSATVDPKDPNLFEFSPRVVAANVG